GATAMAERSAAARRDMVREDGSGRKSPQPRRGRRRAPSGTGTIEEEAAMRARRLLVSLGVLLLVSAPALARVDVTLDADTLNELLSKLAPDHVPVDLHSG